MPRWERTQWAIWQHFEHNLRNRSRGGYIMRINLKALLSKSFEIYAHNKIVPKMSKRQLADQYSTFNYSQLSGENQI